MSGEDELERYLAAVVARLEAVLGDGLAGVYAGGSLALGGYVPGRSDIDLAAISRRPLASDEKRWLVAGLRHEVLPCPARGLELVVYPYSTVSVPTADPGFELNLDTGRRVAFRADVDPGVPDGHWFAIDRSILGRHGLTRLGPPAEEVFAPIPRDVVLPLVAASVRWYADAAEPAAEAVLNACRALRFAEADVWSSKPEAARWALRCADAPGVVAEALACAGGAPERDAATARAFVRGIAERLGGYTVSG